MRRIGVKVAAFGPPVVISVLLMLVVLAAMPPAAAMAGFLGTWLVAVALRLGVGEGAAARVLFGCRPIRLNEVEDLAVVIACLCRVGLGPPVVALWVRERAVGVAADGLGRRTVVLTRPLIEAVRGGSLPPDQAAALIAHAAARVSEGWHRSDVVFGWVAMPWCLLTAPARVPASVVGQIPGVRLVWRARIVVFVVAIAQFCEVGQFGFAALLAVIAAASYGLPYARRDWQRQLTLAGDWAVIDLGMGASLAAFLQHRAPHTPAMRERLRRLDPPVTESRQRLGLVVSR